MQIEVQKTVRSFARKNFSKNTIYMLGITSFIFTLMDALESFYLQKMIVTPYTEVNLFPGVFYSLGSLWYLIYFPVEFLATFAIFLFVWGMAAYLIFLAKRLSSRDAWRI